VGDDIFHHLGPGNTIDLMKDMFGVANKYRRGDSPVFSEDEVETHTYLYVFKNAYVKVTSKDNENIDSLTVLCTDDSISIEPYLAVPEEIAGRLGEIMVSPVLIKSDCKHTFLQTRWDAIFALGIYTGNPLYLHYTFFGPAHEASFEYRKSEDPNLFVGATINGICISESDESAYFIYLYELR